MSVKGLRLGFFGSFNPLVDRLSTTSTGLVSLLSMSEKIEKVLVFAPMKAVAPVGLDTSKVNVIPSWEYDSVLSLLKTLAKMIKMKNDVDVYLFNIFLTSFGKTRRANVIGLLLPPLLAKLTGKRVCTYMHNFIETQDIEKLGYEKKWLSTQIASLLERLIASNTLLLVPLKSQGQILETLFHNKVHNLVVPYVEGICSFMCSSGALYDMKKESDAPLSFLLFGSWGPQKDLDGALNIFRELIDEGKDIKVIVGGKVNSNFPSYDVKIKKIISDFPINRISWIRNLPEARVPELFSQSDVLFLPYNAAGGYSAVMNVGAFYGIKMVAYDLPELRELDTIISAGCIFVDRSDPDAVKRALIRVAEEARRERSFNNCDLEKKLYKSLVAINALTEVMISDEN